MPTGLEQSASRPTTAALSALSSRLLASSSIAGAPVAEAATPEATPAATEEAAAEATAEATPEATEEAMPAAEVTDTPAEMPTSGGELSGGSLTLAVVAGVLAALMGGAYVTRRRAA